MEEKMTRDQAFEILQLDPSASTDKVKKKYENFMRRAKFDEGLNDVEITKAFDTIMGINWGNFEPDEAYTQKGLNKKKVENFFYHYKRSLVYGIAVVAILISVIFLIVVGKKSYDYTILLIGSVNISDQAVMAEYYQELLDLDNVLIDYVLVQVNSEDGSLAEESMNKLFGYFAGGDADICIVTEAVVKFLSYDGALDDLTPYLGSLGIPPDDENILVWYEEGNGQIAAAYEFGNISIFNQGTNGKVPEFFCIPETGDLTEETAIIIKDLINQNK